MQLIRQFELKAEEKYKMAGKIRGFFHAYVGQEALAAGCMTATRQDDPFITAYRDHGWALAKGVRANACMAELYGKATGSSKGKGGSMHFFGVEQSFLVDMVLWVHKLEQVQVWLLLNNTKELIMLYFAFLEMVQHAREFCMKPLIWPCFGNCR